MISLHQVGVQYGSAAEVLRDIEVHFAKGSFHYLCGASGAGKSSLLRLLSLSQSPSRGRVLFEGQEVTAFSATRLAEVRQQVGVVYQDFRLIPALSVFDNVALSVRLTGMTEDQVRRESTEILSWVGLGEYVDDYPLMLSGGQQQRLAIARAAITQPQLLIADEPTGNVDDEGAKRILCLFDEMHRHGTTVVVATHNRRLIQVFPHPILELHQGQLQRGFC